jgi:cyclin-dependent kinase 8/11
MRRSALRRPESLSDKYRILGKIGEGTYGLVFKAEAYSSALLPRPSGSSSGQTEDEEPMTFAIKLVKSHKEGKNDVVLSSATVREIKLLRELHHDNVVHLHDVHVDPRDKSLALVFEYGDHDLHDIIVQSKQKPLGEYTRKSLMYQILKGVDYMHDAWVMHRDMKPQNILVVGHGRKRGQVKLADLGLARIYKEPIKALSDVERVVVTLWYRAPELLLGAKHYTKAVDLWAVGCIFVELINTRELFCGKEVEGSNAPFQKDQLDKIFKVLGMPTPQTWEGLENLPEYNHVVQMGRERKYPTQSELKNAVKVGPGRAGAALLDLLSRLLEYGECAPMWLHNACLASTCNSRACLMQIRKRALRRRRRWSMSTSRRSYVPFKTSKVCSWSDPSLLCVSMSRSRSRATGPSTSLAKSPCLSARRP